MTPVGTILVVDDELSIHGFLAVFLSSQGYRVEAADTVQTAIAILQHHDIDAVVLDVQMPHQSGLAVLEYIRTLHRRPDLPVLILTGTTLNADEELTIAKHRAYVFYKQEDMRDFATYIERVTTAAPS